ncbi:MAG: ABC transporter ATP-binding protein [Luteibaculaceae bacterium]
MLKDNHPPVLTINSLSIAANKGDTTLVNNISFTINQGEIMALVGESGSGKSLTSYAILGLLGKGLHITGGEILLHYENKYFALQKLEQEELRTLRGKAIAMIFQEPMSALNPAYTIGFQIEEAIKAKQPELTKASIYKQCIALLNEVKIPEPEQSFKKYPHQLSGGQKQRVIIAIALANNPALLIADEPTTALDVTVQKQLLALLKNLCKQRKMGMLFITHDLGVVKQIADKTAVLQKGNLIEFGETYTIFNTPTEPYTKGLIACKPPLHKRPKRLLTVSDFTSGKRTEQTLETPEERTQRHHTLFSAEPILKVQALKKSYPIPAKHFWQKENEKVVLHDINFSLYKGEILGLVGESGSGKSTLGRCIMRLIEPNSGTIRYLDKDVLSLNTSELRDFRKKVQIIFQDPFSALNPNLTVGAAIVEPMHLIREEAFGSAEKKKQALFLLEKVGLSADAFEKYPHQFSGGQRQRICIARALALRPEIIICDESVSALDVSVQAQVLNLFNDLKDEFNLTYLFISHDLSVVKYFCDRIMVLQHGKIVALQESDALFENPPDAYTKQLIEAIPQ